MNDAIIIDDNRSAADAFYQMLKVLDISACVAYDAGSAMSLLSGFTPSLILLDINMPDVDGLEILAYLRREPRFIPVPVIVITSDDQPETRARVMKGGATAIIIKPATLEALEENLSKIGIMK